MFEGYREHYEENARLIILKGLAEMDDYRLNDTLLLVVLQTFGINKGRDFLRAQLAWLEKEAGVIRTQEAGTAIIAEILERGLDHVQRRCVVPGIARPSAARS